MAMATKDEIQLELIDEFVDTYNINQKINTHRFFFPETNRIVGLTNNRDGTVAVNYGSAIRSKDRGAYNTFFDFYPGKKGAEKFTSDWEPKTEQRAKELADMKRELEAKFDVANLLLITDMTKSGFAPRVVSDKWLRDNFDTIDVRKLSKDDVLFGKDLWPEQITQKSPTAEAETQLSAPSEIPKDVVDRIVKLGVDIEEIKKDQKKDELVDLGDLEKMINLKLVSPSQLSSLSQELDKSFTRKDGITRDSYQLYKSLIKEAQIGELSVGDTLRKKPIKRNLAKIKKTVSSR